MPVLDTFIAALLGSLHLVVELALRGLKFITFHTFHVTFWPQYLIILVAMCLQAPFLI